MSTGVPVTAILRLHSELSVLTCCFGAALYTHPGTAGDFVNDLIVFVGDLDWWLFKGKLHNETNSTHLLCAVFSYSGASLSYFQFLVNK